MRTSFYFLFPSTLNPSVGLLKVSQEQKIVKNTIILMIFFILQK